MSVICPGRKGLQYKYWFASHAPLLAESLALQIKLRAYAADTKDVPLAEAGAGSGFGLTIEVVLQYVV